MKKKEIEVRAKVVKNAEMVTRLPNLRNKVTKDNQFDYEEEVREFTGLVFHCPQCDEIFHLHIATVKLKQDKRRVN